MLVVIGSGGGGEASPEHLRNGREMRAVDDAVENFPAESAALERSHNQVQVHVVLAVVLGPMEAHPELILAPAWMVLFQEFDTDLLHVTEKL